jgi:hypothetical protein
LYQLLTIANRFAIVARAAGTRVKRWPLPRFCAVIADFHASVSARRAVHGSSSCRAHHSSQSVRTWK